MKNIINYKLLQFLKCPFCDFENIHEETITHHIKYTDDLLHKVDVEKIDKSDYVIEGQI